MPQALQRVDRSAPPVSRLARFRSWMRSMTLGPFSLKDPALIKYFGAGRATASGIYVNDLMAFTFSAVYRAVDGISSDVAKVPLNHRKWRTDGGSDLYDNSNIAELLKVRANPDMSAFTFRQTLTAHALTSHGGYAEIERDGTGRPIALWPIPPDRIRPFVEKTDLSNGNYRTRLRYRVDGQDILEAQDVIHLRGLSHDGYCAYPVIDQARQAIGLALAAEQFGATFFGNGTVFGGVMSTDQTVGPDQEKLLRDSIEKYHQSADKAHKLLFAAGGWKYTRTGIAPNEAQMDELRDKQVEEVARFFDYPLHKLKLAKPGAVSYASAEMSDTDYYKGLMKWFVNWEQELQWKLITKSERYLQFIKHNTNAFMRGDTAARSSFYQTMLDRGVFCADDVLELEDMNPQPNGQGKLYLVQAAQVPKDRLNEIVDAQIASRQAAAHPPAPAPAPADPAPARDDKALVMLETRLQDAEAALRVAQDEARQAREAFAAAEATGVAKAGELERLAATGAERDALSLQLSATVDSLRGELDTARARVEAEQTARQSAEAAAADSERAMQAAEAAAVAATEAERAAGEQAREAQERALAAERLADELRVQMARVEADTSASTAEAKAARDLADAAATEARRMVVDLEAEREAAHLRTGSTEAALQAARLELAEAERLLAEARQQQHVANMAKIDADTSRQAEADARTAAQAQLSQLEQQLAEARATTVTQAHDLDVLMAREQELQSHVTDARAQLTTITGALDATRGAHEGSAAALAAAVAALERDRADAATQIAEHRTALEQAQLRLVAMEQEIRSVRQADADSITTLITAHKDLVSDVMRRMVERETDHARRAQRTPEKLAAWIETFYEGHDELMRAALLPAIRVHLAFIRSTDDPVETTRRLVAQHVQQSQVQLRQVVAGDAEPFAASVSALLYRWDRERSTVIADALMAKELDYARSL
jgi:HK97 family phage portal protein